VSKKKALITGITGQDGAYLAKFLLQKGYEVIGGERQNASGNKWRLKELGIENKIQIVPFELLEENSINKEVRRGKYDEIYNLAAQSYVDKSFVSPIYTTNVNALGVIRILEALRQFSNKTKFYQASSSEMYGNNESKIQDEKTSFKPISPYAISKLHAHWMLGLYRNAYNLHCSSGILFNHESPLRSNEFVTQKIITNLIKVKFNLLPCIKLGNIYAKRDWGYSEDYIQAMWKMLQQKKPGDFVISSGNTYTVKDFVKQAAKYLGFNLSWQGKGINEKAINKNNNKLVLKIDKKFFRPNDIQSIHGNSNKAKKILKWKSKTSFEDLVKIMCDAELKKYK
tara:strand:- start:1764 stop:2783 length:1020 start_codon:yes stop_codon:yes gene_type:complete